MKINPRSAWLVAVCVLPSCEQEGAFAAPVESPDGKPTSHPWDWVPEAPDLAAGRETYLAECSLCHNEGDESAPALTRADEWQKRADKGLPTLVRHAIEGFIGEDGKMPARGGSDYLTDEQIEQTVRYMIAAPKSSP